MSRKLPGSAIVPGTITVTQITGGLNDTTNASYAQANTARTTANDAYGQANTASDQANTARTQANTAYGQANNAYSSANLAYDQANASYNVANTKLASAGGTLSGDLIITGNLTVSGNSTTLNTEVLTVEDAEVILLSNVASTPALNAGIIVNRGTSTNTFLRWDEALDEWGWSDSGNTTYYFEDLRAGLATTNTTFGTINTSLGTINTSYQAAYAQANTAGTNALNAYGQANAAYGAANNRVLKAGDTMTGQLNISAGGLLVTGNVGIGTTSPGYLFDVNGDARFGSGTPGLGGKINAVGSGGTYISATYTTPTPSITTFMGSDSSNYGMVGTFSAHDFVIRSNNTARVTFPSGGGGMTLSGSRPIQISTNDGALFITADSGGWSMGTYYKGSSGTIRAGFGALGSADALTYAWIGTDHTNAWMAFLGSGNVGIGTTSPATTLHVDASSGGIVRVSRIGTGAGILQLEADGTDGTITTTNNMKFVTSGEEQMRLDTSGNLFLNAFSGRGGGSTGYLFKLNPGKVYFELMANNTTSQSDILFTDGAAGAYGIVGYDHSNDSLRFYTNSSWQMTVNSSGYLGIGNTAPPRRLTVQALGTSNYEMVVGWAAQSLSQNATMDVICTHDSLAFQVWDDNNYTTPRFVVERGGDVGIGTANPSQKLDVVGNIKASGTMAANGTIDVAGDGGAGYVGSRVILRTHDNYRGAGIFMVGETSAVSNNTFYIGTPYANHGGGLYFRHTANNYQTDYQSAAFTSAGNTIMYMSPGGQVTKPLQPAFLVSSAGFSKSTSWEKISQNLTSVNHNIGSHFNTSNGRFTAPVAGRYMFYAGGWANPNANGDRYGISAVVNGGSQTFITGGDYCNVDSPLSAYIVTFNLAANDYVELYAYSSVSGTWGTSSHNLYFGGYLLG